MHNQVSKEPMLRLKAGARGRVHKTYIGQVRLFGDKHICLMSAHVG